MRTDIDMQDSCQRRGIWIFGLVFFGLVGGQALGQTLGPTSGRIFPTPDDLHRRHKAPTGKPCLALEGSSKAQTINKNIYEHWIGAANSCGQHIKVRICYHNTQDCIVMDVPAYGRRESVLGIYPALKDFRYDYVEQF